MAGDITNIVLLQHMHAMKTSLEEKIEGVERTVIGLAGKVQNLSEEMQRGFEEAAQHRQALQEDLEATMRVQGRHETKLARLTKIRSV